MKKLFLCLSATVCLLGVSTYAANGVVISMKTTTGASSATSQIQLDANHMRAEMAGRGGSQNTVVFDGAKQAMYLIDDANKTYSEITKDDLDKMAAQLQQAQQQMQSAMGNLSPEQRAQVEAMMRGRGGRGMPGMGAPAAAAKPTYKKTGTDKVGKWTCDKYEGYEGERKTSEVCTVAPTALGLTAGDFEVTKQFAKFFSGIMPNMSDRVFSLGSLEDRGFVGVPIRTVTYGADGSVQGTSELTDINHQNIPDATFAPPSGYTKQDMGFGRGRGRRGGL